jgi:hypothetical protein
VKTEVGIDGTKFTINGRPTCEGVEWRGHPVEGLLLNSRMVQAVFDDECPETRRLWAYPDTGEWDPDRNTDEFCAALPEYRAHGMLAFTVGLQGGGSVYHPDVYDNYVCSAFEPDGTFRQPYFDRLLRVIRAADDCGMVAIVNYFYWKQVEKIPEDRTLYDIAERTTEWLLKTGYRNILVDVANESEAFWKRPILEPGNVHTFIEAAQSVTVDGRRLLIGSSTGGGDSIPRGKWLDAEDFSMPHGNLCTTDQLRAKLRELKGSDGFIRRPRPILINEDSIFVDNLDVAVEEHASWGFYCQGYGSGNKLRMDWRGKSREDRYEDLSGYQTLPVNWGINTEFKRAFFDRVKEITGGA